MGFFNRTSQPTPEPPMTDKERADIRAAQEGYARRDEREAEQKRNTEMIERTRMSHVGRRW